MAGFKLPKDLEQIAKEHGLSKSEVEQFADQHNVTGLVRGGNSAPMQQNVSPDMMMQQAYASNKAVTSDRERYAEKKDHKAKKKREKGHAALDKAAEARASGNEKRAERLERRAARKFAKADKKEAKAHKIRTDHHW
tara:strand:+ start:72 stop:482 length:411 start_codon:yes stop_codon:yes gene_type:complete